MKPTEWFHPDPDNPRKDFDPVELDRLGDDMVARGVLVAVLAKPEGTIIDGERRWRAAKMKGIKELPVIVTDRPEREIRGIQLATVFHKADLNFHEKWMACAELMCANPNWQMKDLADYLHIDPSSVTRILSPSKCTAAWQEALKAGKVGISDCYAASKLPESEQAGLLALKLSGMSRDNLERHTRRQRVKPSAKTGKVRIAMRDNIAVVLSGGDFGMAEVVDVLGDALKEARKASEQYDVKTFQSMMRDRAKLQR